MRTLAEALRLYQDERYEEAARRLQVVCEFEPDNVQAWLYYGAALGKMDKWPHAAAAFDRVVTLQPDQASGYFNLAHASHRCGDLAAAEVAIAHALALEPNNPSAEHLRDEIHAALRPRAAAAPPKPPPPKPEPAAPIQPAPPVARGERRPLPYLLAVLAVLLVVSAVVAIRGASEETRRLRLADRLLDEALALGRQLAGNPGEDLGVLDQVRALRDRAESALPGQRGSPPAELWYLLGRVAWERDRSALHAKPLFLRALEPLESAPADQPRLVGGSAAELRAGIHRRLVEVCLLEATGEDAAAALREARGHLDQAVAEVPSSGDAALREALERAEAELGGR